MIVTEGTNPCWKNQHRPAKLVTSKSSICCVLVMYAGDQHGMCQQLIPYAEDEEG